MLYVCLTGCLLFFYNIVERYCGHIDYRYASYTFYVYILWVFIWIVLIWNILRLCQSNLIKWYKMGASKRRRAKSVLLHSYHRNQFNVRHKHNSSKRIQSQIHIYVWYHLLWIESQGLSQSNSFIHTRFAFIFATFEHNLIK